MSWNLIVKFKDDNIPTGKRVLEVARKNSFALGFPEDVKFKELDGG